MKRVKKRAADITSGKEQAKFDRRKTAEESRKAFNKESERRPPEAKEEFNKKREFRVFRDQKEQRDRTSNDNQETDSGIKKEFNVFRKMKEERERENEQNKGGGRLTNKSVGRELG